MDGVSWRTTRAQESFIRPGGPAETLSKLASFIARAETKQHAAGEGGQPSHLTAFVCQECGKGFPYTTDLLHHQKLKHTLPKPHRCPSCGQGFSLRSTLQLHRCDQSSFLCDFCHGELHHGSSCPSCADSSRLQDKSPHCQPHLLDRSPYACAPCGRGFAQKQALLHHQQSGCSQPPSPSCTVHACSLPDDSPPVSEGDLTRSDFLDTPVSSNRAGNSCQFCSRRFRSAAALQRHKQAKHPEVQLMAPQRLKTKRGGGRVGRRGGVKVNKDPLKNPISKPLNCRSCDMVFWSTSKLYLHRKERHSRDTSTRREAQPVKCRKRDSHPCQICGKVFVHHLSLRSHYRQHSASSFSAYRHRIQSLESAKDSSENPSTKAKSSQVGSKTVQAGRGSSKKLTRLRNKVTDTETCKKEEEEEKEEVVEVEDKEEEEEEEEEEEDGKEFPCPSCPEVFSVQSQLKKHVELHQSSVKRRRCSVCADEMDMCKRQGSRRHRLYHCVPCQQGFSTLDPFLQHCQEHVRVRVDLDCMTENHTYQASEA